LAALYAAGALPHDELANFEAHLDTGCELCLAELRLSVRVTAELFRAIEPVMPDPKVRDYLRSRVAPSPNWAAGTSPLRERVLGDVVQKSLPHTMIIRKAAGAEWEGTAVEGVTIRTLFVDEENNQFTALVRMAPGTSYPRHIHGGPEQCLVLEGDLRVGEDVLHAGDYQRAPTGSYHPVQSTEGGCLLLITSSLTDQFV
jgi:anti-sigma factor ChrR (cupin superfamily)